VLRDGQGWSGRAIQCHAAIPYDAFLCLPIFPPLLSQSRTMLSHFASAKGGLLNDDLRIQPTCREARWKLTFQSIHSGTLWAARDAIISPALSIRPQAMPSVTFSHTHNLVAEGSSSPSIVLTPVWSPDWPIGHAQSNRADVPAGDRSVVGAGAGARRARRQSA
jgi:hypothetical protein